MKRLLIVEDDQDLRALLSEYLRETLQMHVVVAGSPLQVRVAVQSGPFDAVLLDLNMDGTTPGELVEQIRESPGNREVPLIIVSAYDARDLARSTGVFARRILRQMVALRPSACVTKPFALDTLVQTIQGAWSRDSAAWGQGRCSWDCAGCPVSPG